MLYLLLQRREVRIRKWTFLSPAKTGARLEIGRGTRSARQSISVRPIGINVHIGLQQCDSAVGFGMSQLEHRLAIVKVMARKELIEAAQVFSEGFEFHLIELFEKRRH